MNNLPVILSLETATLGGSIFLARGVDGLAAKEGDAKISHSNSLLADIAECLGEAGLTLLDVELFACASGPGSFTGLRIGIATLKALAATLQRPCVGVPTLNAIAHSAGSSSRTVALLPAGRGEVFTQLFSVSADGEVVGLDEAAHLSPQALIERYGRYSDLIWAGSGAHLHRSLLQNHAEQYDLGFFECATESNVPRRGWCLAAPELNVARHVSALALKSFALGRLQNAETLSALYVRPSDAEIRQPWQ
jgi:tRNA threonylcarbamoyladenosine biosynthesis protein TsaB